MQESVSMNARKCVHAQKPYPSQAFAHESSKVGGRGKRETEFKTALESEKIQKMPYSEKKYKCICALYLGKTNFKYQLTGFAILSCLAAIYILYIYLKRTNKKKNMRVHTLEFMTLCF